MKKSSFVLFAILLVLFSCDSGKEVKDEKTVKTDSTEVEVAKDESVLEEFNGDTLFIPQKFRTELDSAQYALLERLELCTGRLENDTLDAMNPPCDGRLFRFYQLNDELSKNELFLIEMKKGLYGNLDNKIVSLI